MLELDLEGQTTMSGDRRRQLDAQMRQYLRASTSAHVWTYIRDASTAFDAYWKLKKLFNTTKTQDLIRPNTRFRNLKFKKRFDRTRFIADFENLFIEYADLDCIFSEQYKIVEFLQKLEGIHEVGFPISTLYNSISIMQPEDLTYELVKIYPISATKTTKNDERRESQNKM